MTERLRNLMHRHAAQLLHGSVSIEVPVGGRMVDGRWVGGSTLTFNVQTSDFAKLTRRMRVDATIARADAAFYLDVPSGGLPFVPATGQTVIADGYRWPVSAVVHHRVDGVTVGFWVACARGTEVA